MARKNNLKNVEATQFKSGLEAAENGRKGGKASGEVRRKKRSMKSAAKLLLGMGVMDEETSVKLAALGLPEEEMTYQMAVLSAMLTEAQSGNVRAAEFLRDSAGESPSAEIHREDAKARKKELEAAAKIGAPDESEVAKEVEGMLDEVRRQGGGSASAD